MATGTPASSLMAGSFAGRYDCPPAKNDGTTPVSTFKGVDIYYRSADRMYFATIGLETHANGSLVGCMQRIEGALKAKAEAERITELAIRSPHVITPTLWPTPNVAELAKLADEMRDAGNVEWADRLQAAIGGGAK